MKNRTNSSALISLISVLHFVGLLVLIPTCSNAQAVGTWSFGGTLAGTGTSSNTVSPAALGSGITTSGFSSGVFYGEGTWPAGAINLNDYLEFSLTPNSGHKLNLSGISMNIRRSTTGTAAGSGPNNWSLRSNLDGFTTDITTGILSLSTSPTTIITLGASFNNLSSTITFRLYGYNATVSTGGLNRFCYQNITVNGLILLPVLLQNFNTKVTAGHSVQLNWTLNGEAGLSSIQVQRSIDGDNFIGVQNLQPLTNEPQEQYSYVDANVPSGEQHFFYRIKITGNESDIYYSEVHEVTLSSVNLLSISALPVRAGGNLEVKVNADIADNYHFYLYSISGVQVAVKTIMLSSGTQFMQMENVNLHPGIYVLCVERNGEKVTTELAVQ